MNNIMQLKKGEKVARSALILESILAASKAIVGYLSGSLVLISDAVHSASDLLPIFASYLGLKIAQKDPDEKFAYGYYKAENIASAMVSVLVLFAGYKVISSGINNLDKISSPNIPFIAMAVSLVDAVVLFFFGKYEIKVAEEINSNSLKTMGKENRTHIFTSSTVLVGILASYLGIPYLEGIFTIGISFLIFEIGLTSGKDAILALMDVVPQKEIEEKIAKAIASVPGIEEYYDLKLRRSGPYILGETKVGVRKSIDVKKSHEISEKVEEAVKKEVQVVDSFTVHVEPFKSEYQHLVLPVKSKKGLQAEIAPQFGRAAYFLFVNLKKNEVKGHFTTENKYKNKKVRAGLEAAKMIVQKKSTAVITSEMGEITFHFLRDNLFDIFKTSDNKAEGAIGKFKKGQLEMLKQPTKKAEGNE